MAITYLGNAEGVSAYKKSYHQFSLNNLMKIESLEFKLYFDGVIFFGHLCLIFSRCKAFTANNKWPGRPNEINHFLRKWHTVSRF